MPLTINMINITIKFLLYGTIFILILAFIISTHLMDIIVRVLWHLMNLEVN